MSGSVCPCCGSARLSKSATIELGRNPELIVYECGSTLLGACPHAERLLIEARAEVERLTARLRDLEAFRAAAWLPLRSLDGGYYMNAKEKAHAARKALALPGAKEATR